MGDTSTQQSAFLQSLSEGWIAADSEAIAAQFAASRAENIDMADDFATYFALLETRLEPIDSVNDTPTIAAQFAVSRAENSNLSDPFTSTAQFLGTITEPMTMGDVNPGS